MTKSIVIQIRVDPNQHKDLLSAAQRHGQTLSEWVREQLLVVLEKDQFSMEVKDEPAEA